MFVEEIRRAIEASPRMKLPEVTALLWRAYGEGRVTEDEAEQLSNLIDARRALPTPIPARKKVGTRPRTPASIERRRRWAASGAMPVGLAVKFTAAEQAALAVVADEVRKRGRCDLYVGHIAARAGVSETVVRNALREAKKLRLVAVEARRVAAWRNDSNLVTVISPEWIAWLARGGRGGGGCTSALGTVSGGRSTPSAHSGRGSRAGLGEEAALGRECYRGGGGQTRSATSTHGMAPRIASEGHTGRSGSYPVSGTR